MDSPKIKQIRDKIQEKEEEISKLRSDLREAQNDLNKSNAPNLVGKFFKKHTQAWGNEYLKIIQYNKTSHEYKCLHIRISYATGYHVALNWMETNYDIVEDGYRTITKEEFNSVLQDVIGRLEFNSSHMEQVIDIKNSPEEYVKYFKHYFGYEKDFFPSEGYREVADLLSNEIKLNLLTDTTAMEKEGKAVMLLVLSNDKTAVKIGMTLGNIMMQEPINVHELMATMKDACYILYTLPDRRRVN